MAPTINQQQCIKDTFGIPAAVVAGAGSGKTDTLTRRIAYALLHPEESGVTDIDQILAITYTNKAAAELKARIKQVLDEEATSVNGLRDQALKADGAWISTIHGMCSRILRENALAFGIDPAFALAQDEVLDALIEEAIGQVIVRVIHEPASPEETQLLKEYGRDKLAGFMRTILASSVESAEDNPFAFCVCPTPQDPVEYVLQVVACTQEVLQRIEAKQASASAKLLSKTEAAYYDQALASLGAIFGLSTEETSSDAVLTATVSNERLEELRKMSARSLLSLVDRFPKLRANLKIAKEPLETTGLLPSISLLQAAFNVRLAIGSQFLPTVLHLARQAHEHFMSVKREAGYLDNSDLLTLVAQKLQDPAFAPIAERYANQFRLVMVDEFQDTNQMQVDMINLVAGGAQGALSQKMCVVGDAQQSIYRFRGADLAVFTEYVRRVQESEAGAVIKLGDNFRSHAEILAFCKGIFAPVFGDDYLDLLHGRDEERAAAQGAYFGGTQHDDASIPRRVNVKTFKPKGSAGVAKMAAREIARDFRELVDRGNRPGEMAILLGRMTNADVFAQALHEVGLKCAITGGTVFRDSTDVQLIADLCTALLNPFDTEALANVLTSDLFCLSADDLLVLVSMREGTKGSLADAFVRGEVPSDASAALRHAVHVLHQAMNRVGEQSLGDVVNQVLVESGWLHRQESEGLSRAANAFKAVRILKDIEDESPVRGFGVIKRFKDRLVVAKEAPGVLSTEGDDFVRIMTIHASKGLSIPIVAVAESEYRPENLRTLNTYARLGKIYLALDAGRSLENLESSGLVKSAPRASADHYVAESTVADALRAIELVEREEASTQALDRYYSALYLLNCEGELEEHQRRLYVAFTRAKDALIVTHRAEGSKHIERDNGRPTVTQAIMNVLDGVAPLNTQAETEAAGGANSLSGVGATSGADAFQVEAVTHLVPLETRYPEAPSYDLDWQLRYQLFTMQDNPLFDGELGGLEDDAADSDAVALATQAGMTDDDAQFIEVPVRDPQQHPSPAVPYKAQWAEGVVSASSLKDASGEHVEEIDPDPVDPDVFEAVQSAQMLDSVEDENDSTDAPASATERGTAFHALCEWAATHRQPGQPMAVPPHERIQAMVRLYGLNKQQEESLQVALSRWLSSAAAASAANHAFTKAEQPFWVQLRPAQEGSEPLILQGFIDLLCYDQPYAGKAYVVDYKTGTGYNTDEKRRHAYELQAMCYAYALLKQGFTDVQLDFVFVDQPSADNPDEPVIVHFPALDDKPWTADSLQARILETL